MRSWEGLAKSWEELGGVSVELARWWEELTRCYEEFEGVSEEL